MRTASRWILGIVAVAIVLLVGVQVVRRLPAAEAGATKGRETGPVPVEVADVTHGPIENRRTFSGTLEAAARVTVAPKIAGRIVRLPVELADVVKRNQVVAELDRDEYDQEVMQAEAELAVARANVAEAESAAKIAARELERMKTLQDRGVASESQLDVVMADDLAKGAAVEVAKARATRAESALQTARIRRGYTRIEATWSGDDEERVVAERFAEEGETVAANTPLLSIIKLNPIRAVIHVTERDYAELSPGQPVTLRTDAYADRTWSARIGRVAPAFREGSRQARVEVDVPNEDGALKPGMFVRVEAVLGRREDATIVPAAALVDRDGGTVVFVVSDDDASVRLAKVETGIREGDRVEVTGDDVGGRVVTLGQQLLGDGSAITIPEAASGAS